MKQSNISFSTFSDGFASRRENFTYQGLCALYDYFTDLEDSIGEEIEFDPIAICCEYSQFDNLEDFQSQYNDSYESIEYIENDTTVIRVDDDIG